MERIAFGYHRESIKERIKKKDKEEEIAKQDEIDTSIKNSKEMVEDYCKRNKIILARNDADVDYSGDDYDRPVINDYLDLAGKKVFNVLIVKDLSRLGRGDVGKQLLYAFRLQGVEVISLGNDIGDEATEYMWHFVNGMWVIISRMKTRAMNNGKMNVGKAFIVCPFGYVYDKEKNWIKDNRNHSSDFGIMKKWEVVKKIFEGIDFSQLNITEYQYKTILDNKRKYEGYIFYYQKIKDPITKKLVRKDYKEYKGNYEPIL